MRSLLWGTVCLVGSLSSAVVEAVPYTYSSLGDGGYWLAPSTDGNDVGLGYPRGRMSNVSVLESGSPAGSPRTVAYGSVSWGGSPIPDSSASFTMLGAPVVDHGVVAFAGAGGNSPETARQGVYASVGGQLRTIADSTMQAIGGTGRLTTFDFNTVNISRGDISFTAADEAGMWAAYRYRQDQGLELLLNTNTPPPERGGGRPPFAPFGYFSDTDYQNGLLAFQSGSGVFLRKEDGSLVNVMNVDMAIPGDPMQAPSYAFDINLSGDDVVFKWWSSSGVSVYRWDEQQGLEAIIPLGSNALGDIATDEIGNIALEAGQNIYLDSRDEALQRLIGSGDSLFGKTISFVDLGPHGIGNGVIVFKAYFDDGSSELVRAEAERPVTVSEPATLGLAMAGVGMLLGAGRRKPTARNSR